MNNIYILYGNNIDSIKERVSELTSNRFTQRFEFNNTDDFDSLQNINVNLSLFEQNLFILFEFSYKFFQYLEKSQENIYDILNNLLLKNNIIISLYLEKLDKTIKKQITETALLQYFKNKAIVEEYIKLNFWQIDEIKKYTLNIATKYDLTFKGSALNAFLDHFADSTDLIRTELQKLQIYCLPDNVITENTIQELYKAEVNLDTIFNSLILQNNLQIGFDFKSINTNDNLLYILASLQNKIRQTFKILVFLKSGITNTQISKLLNTHPYKLELEIKKIKNININNLIKKIDLLSSLEFKLKGGILKDSNFLDRLVIAV